MATSIDAYLRQILSAVYGKDVRQAIHDAISTCYSNVGDVTLNTEAFARAIADAIEDGSLAALSIEDGSITKDKLADYTITRDKIASGVVPTIDKTLLKSGCAADAAIVGSKLPTQAQIKNGILYLKNADGATVFSVDLITISGGSTSSIPSVVQKSAQMIDRTKVYIYGGNEDGYQAGDWYYYSSSIGAWVDGGLYGGVTDEDLEYAVRMFLASNSTILTNADTTSY